MTMLSNFQRAFLPKILIKRSQLRKSLSLFLTGEYIQPFVTKLQMSHLIDPIYFSLWINVTCEGIVVSVSFSLLIHQKSWMWLEFIVSRIFLVICKSPKISPPGPKKRWLLSAEVLAWSPVLGEVQSQSSLNIIKCILHIHKYRTWAFKIWSSLCSHVNTLVLSHALFCTQLCRTVHIFSSLTCDMFWGIRPSDWTAYLVCSCLWLFTFTFVNTTCLNHSD